MGYAAGEATHDFHLLGLGELLLQTRTPRDVADACKYLTRAYDRDAGFIGAAIRLF